MGSLVYQVISSAALFTLGIYHLITTTRNYLKSPLSYAAKPFHPFPYPRRLPLYLVITSLLLAMAHHLLISADADPLVRGATAVHRITSLQSAASLFLFLLLALALLLADASPALLPLPPDLSFALASALFLLHASLASARASLQTSAIEAKCLSVSASLSHLSALLCLLLAALPRLFPADVALSAAFCLRGLWALQSGLSLYADAFIPEGCHRLLDVTSGVEGSTQCDLDESKLRAVAILDLAFLIHTIFVVLIVLLTYALVCRSVGGRRLGSYEALPTAASPTDANHSHIQMKAFTGTQA
ncbi:hypothetical protein AAZX31_16G043200 [Glycine max]|uniref:Uncharacterized protein n=1 Tax=Glycine soja TaxID=3848 RepID=A0A445GEG8_GLYSO|nr:uncharacterized protein LOC114389393 [Glycine soja]KAG4938256.1 hypothetical protein JHK86_044397 [Glycine max]KAG5101013.1 hypothetical protein JHK82_046065 [Glycine max]KAG5107600.1 hypothetical protein JHK84_044507 [Glycine max]KAH1149974.1 hypothetical protein GYH30_044141 [Glycine max]RZB59585.1 hypothetical protein D0Y65_042700 [Glycine soja]